MGFVEPRVTLIAQTQLSYTWHDNDRGHHELKYNAEEWLPWNDDDDPKASDFVAEYAGRGCYDAFDRPNPATAANRDYLRNIINLEHESVFGHASATFDVRGVSRSLTHELVRHRFLVFSQRSQRFVDESECDFVLPPLLDDPTYAGARDIVEQALTQSRLAYKVVAERLIAQGVQRKRAREAARAVLPEATETRLVVSGNIRAWRDFVKLRDAPGADAEIRRFARLVLAELREIAPNSVQDFS